MKNELEFLKNQVLKTKGLSDSEKKRVLEEIANGKLYDFNTGYATIDQPWMKHHKNSKLEEELIGTENKTVWDVVEESLEKYSSIPMIQYFNNSISREEFANYVEMWARTFKALGVEKGDHIPLYVPATPESYAMFLSANAIGAIPYYQKLAITKEQLNEETKEAKIAVVFDALWNNVGEVFKQDRFKNVIVTSAADSMMFPLKQLTKFKSHFDNIRNKNGIPNTDKYIWADKALKMSKYYTGDYKVPFDSDRIAIITTSSGTTSHVVKGTMDTNEGIIHSIIGFKNGAEVYEPGMKTLTCFPPTASTSMNCLQLVPTISGGTIIFDPRVDMSLWYEQVMDYRPNITVTTGPVWEKFANDLLANEGTAIKHDLSWADAFLMGGAGTTPEILDYINHVITDHNAPAPINVGYGFSEIFGPIGVSKTGVDYNKDCPVLNVGLPIPGYKVGIFDENGDELPYGKGYRGELWVKCDANMHGYYGKEELTKKTIIDGWVHSGDLCELDKDGNIYCYGRLKNKVNVANKDVYLFDISNDVREKFNLHDIFVENKNLDDGTVSLNAYFVQEETKREDSKDLIQRMNNYLATQDITISGYKEFTDALPIDPTTLKPKNKDTSGFINYDENNEYEISYDEVRMDVYKENKIKQPEKILIK